jgi:hypothetical protein
MIDCQTLAYHFTKLIKHVKSFILQPLDVDKALFIDKIN